MRQMTMMRLFASDNISFSTPNSLNNNFRSFIYWNLVVVKKIKRKRGNNDIIKNYYSNLSYRIIQ
jgi:hypothetical protein